jgi:hypothetical protein
MKQKKKLTRIEKIKLSKLLNKDLSYESNQAILKRIKEHEEKQLKSFKKSF